MPRLVALVMPAGTAFVDAVRRCWDRGDAVAPVDPRAPAPLLERQLDALAPELVVDATGVEVARAGGVPTEEGDALVILSSGTSGAPKGAVLTRDAVESHAYAATTSVGVDPEATWLACLPLHHIGGFGVVARALVTGARLVTHDGFDAAAVTAAAAAGATHTSLVPTALGRIDPSVFRVILLGGSAIPADRPANTIATYGMTESCGGVVYDGFVLNGVGLEVGADGVISLSGPTMLRAYRDGRAALDEHGWFRTGDLGEMDAATGRLTVLGRADDLIITGGEKVWPDAVERVLVDHVAGVADVAVVGRDDPEWGQRVVAVVVPADRARPPSLDEVRTVVREHLPAAAAPKAIELAEAIPRTNLGKVRRHLL